MSESIEQVTNERNQLRESNRILANQVAGFGRMFEENKKLLMAHGWDACADHVTKETDGDIGDTTWIKNSNPFRKEDDDLDT